MNFRTILYGSAAAALLAAAVPAVTPIDLSPIAPAQAAASVSFSVFYDDLAPHGDWVSYHDGYVFVPAGVGPNWRPYTVGRWVWTDDYGWMWVSDEPFGWATYHYGRWAFADEIGWYWVPGSRWAPAWVSWRQSDDHVVWAPLPPSGDPDLAISISIGTIPDYYWVAVPTHNFLEVNLSVVIIDDDDDRRRIIREARDEDRVRARNDRMVNVAFEPEFIEERTGQKVPRREVRRSERPGRENVSDESVTVFNEEIRPERDRKPEKVKKVEEVRRGGGAGDEQTAEEQPPEETGEGVAEGTPESPDPAKAKRRKLQATQGDEQTAEEQPPEEGVAEGTPESPDPAKTKRRKLQATQGDEQPEGDEQVPANRRKKPPQQADQGDEPAVQKQRRKKPIIVDEGDNAAAEEQAPVKTVQPRRAKPAQQAAEEPGEEGQTRKAIERKRQSAEQPAQRKKPPAQRKKARGCDPSVNPDCQAD